MTPSMLRAAGSVAFLICLLQLAPCTSSARKKKKPLAIEEIPHDSGFPNGVPNQQHQHHLGTWIKMQSIPMFPTATTFNSAVNWLLSRSAAHFSFQGNLVIFYFIVWGLKSFLDSSFLVSLSYLPKNVLGKRKWKVNLFLSLPTWNTLAYQKKKKKKNLIPLPLLFYCMDIKF